MRLCVTPDHPRALPSALATRDLVSHVEDPIREAPSTDWSTLPALADVRGTVAGKHTPLCDSAHPSVDRN